MVSKSIVAALTALALSGGAMAESLMPRIANLSVNQTRADRIVTISFDLCDAPGIVMLDVATNGVSIGAANFPVTEEGAAVSCLNRITQAGTHHILKWDTLATWPGQKLMQGELSVKVTAYSLVQPPDWMVVDLLTKSNAVFYVNKSDIPGNITDYCYKTTKLLMRKIHAGAAKAQLGSPVGESSRRDANETQHYVTLTNDYYIGVYELTQGQHSNAYVSAGMSYYSGSKPSVSTYTGEDAEVHPFEGLSLYYFRENVTDSSAKVDWPNTSRAKVGNRTFLGFFRKFTGFCFDLPTESEWEYACRAGTTTPFNDGTSSAANVAWSAGAGSTKEVGTKNPNAWDLYDMHGNVIEWCLDYYSATQYDGTDVVSPVGPTTGSTRVLRGGSWRLVGDDCRSANRGNGKNNQPADTYGYRLWCSADLR